MSTNQLLAATSSEESAPNRLSHSQRPTNRLQRAGSGNGAGQEQQLGAGAPALQRAPSTIDNSQEIFVLPRQKSRSKDRRESRMFLVDGQLCWADDLNAPAGAGGGPTSMPAGFMAGKRSSSIGLMFGSSMDLSGYGQSIDSSGGAGSGSEEAISYRIKWCRDNIVQLKRQCWPMEKKLQVLRASKLFIKQHQGELKQSKQAKDVIAGTSAIFERYWRHFRRELANFLVIITPWEMRIKKIESHFGSVVASYFTFLRWIFWLNLANSLVLCSFVMVPELIENVPDLTGMRKGELGMDRNVLGVSPDAPAPEFNPTLGEMWEFEGFLKFSPIFYGYYSNVEISRSGFWRNPLAFLMSAMLTYLFCFFSISRKLSQNTKMSRIGSKDDEYTFCWTVFVGWDFMIGNSETAYNKTSSLVMNLKEGILEEKEQTKDRDWSLIMRRVFANVLTILLIVASAYVVTLAVQRSENLPEDASLLQKNELQLVMSGIQFMFPPLFDVIGIIEKYHPRKALSWQLGRILFLDFLNFYTLMFSLFGTVDQMTHQLNEVSGNITLLRKNATYYGNLFTTTTTTTTTTLAPPPSSTQVLEMGANGSLALNATGNATANAADSSGSGLPPLLINLNGSEIQPANATTNLTEYRVDSYATTTSAPTGLNATNLLTTILLASSTVLPPASDQTITSMMSSVSPAGASYDATPPTISSATMAMTPADQSTYAVASVQTETLSASTLDGRPATGPASSTPKDDEDYPDIQGILGESLQTGAQSSERSRRAAAKGRPPLRKLNGGDLGERDETILIDPKPLDEMRDDLPSINRPPTVTHQRLAGLPPIRDPYGKLGQNQPLSGVAWPRTTPQAPYGQMVDYDDDEPLEGRLQVRPKQPNAHPPSGHHHRGQQAPAFTRRPSQMRSGVARPIGGRQQSNRVVGGNPAGSSRRPSKTDLNSDSNEDLAADGETPPLASDSPPIGPNTSTELRPGDSPGTDSEFTTTFVEPTTIQPSTIISMEGDAAQTSPGVIAASGGTLEPSSGAGQSAEGGGSPDETPAGFSEGAGRKASSRAGFGGMATVQESPVAESSTAASFASSTKSGGECGSNFVVETTNQSMMADGNSSSNLLASNAIVKLNASEDQSAHDNCAEIPEFKHQEIVYLNSTFKDKLKNLCWETMFGQEMVKMVVMDLVMTIVSAVSFEFMRACFVRYCNRFFFWDLERGFPGYQDFKIAENVLHLVNNQSTVWMGMFFAPGLPAINTVKLVVLMYVRSWAVLTCNIPHETVFKVSKSNNFYYWILLINLLICILPVAYAVTWIRPSWHCGPFGGECRMYLVVTKLLKQLLPPEANSVFRYVTSPGAVIPILIALILIIYYLASTVSSSKEANKELKAQLKKDKEQESAVPEITNTTVVDPAPAGPSGPNTGAATAAAPAPSASTPSAAAAASMPASAKESPLGGLLLAPQSAEASGDAPSVRQISQDNELTKPKSLLMPPPMT